MTPRATSIAFTGMVALAASCFIDCQAVLGLGSETDLPEAGGADAGKDARPPDAEAGKPLGAAVVVSSSTDSSDWCAVTAGGEVLCWGNNESGELGDGTTKDSRTPMKVVGLPGPAQDVSVGLGTACALLRTGAVYCWGYGADGELGNGKTPAFSTTAVPVSGLESGVTSMSSGNATSCAVQHGALLCWGYGGSGMLGTENTDNATRPSPVSALARGVTSVSVGLNVACAVKDGAALCWGGFDESGDLGNGTTSGSNTPVGVHGLSSGVALVSAGDAVGCALTTEGGVLCWGDGTRGALGNGELAMSSVPVQVQGLSRGVTSVSVGLASVSALESDGTVRTWGYASFGALGNGSAESDSGIGGGQGGASATPVKVLNLSGPAISLSTGDAPCVATRAGSVECWGITAENVLAPVSLTDLGGVTSITTGGYLDTGSFGCARLAGGTIACWGGNGIGQLGNGTETNSAIPVENCFLQVGATAVAGGTGGDFACGIAGGLVYCWGDNSSGQLGNGSTTSSPSPVAVAGLTEVTSVAAGATSACAITKVGSDAGEDAGGALYCWGDNTFGQLGTGNATASLTPVPVVGLSSGVLEVSIGVYSACARLVDGTLDCWGNNNGGQLGNGTTNQERSPSPVAGLTGVTDISVGWYSACAVTSGSVECWGDNAYGQLGDGSFIASGRPQSVPVTGAVHVSVGASSACAIVTGAVACWGTGPIGNDGSPELAWDGPVPVVGLTSGATAIAVGVQFACAVVDGGVQCWGQNSDGELGNGGAVDAFLPAPVPGFP